MQRTLETARASAADDIELWCTPTTQHPALLELEDRFALTLRTQAGAGLGERMCFALEQGLRSYRRVALVGSDCMDLAAADIDLALGATGRGNRRGPGSGNGRRVLPGCAGPVIPATVYGYCLGDRRGYGADPGAGRAIEIEAV